MQKPSFIAKPASSMTEQVKWHEAPIVLHQIKFGFARVHVTGLGMAMYPGTPV